MNNCNLTTCRYNADGKCENEEKRKECVEVAKKVLCIDEENNDIEHWLNREIEMAKISMGEYAECFDGVKVDNNTRKELLKSHIRFCENALKILRG